MNNTGSTIQAPYLVATRSFKDDTEALPVTLTKMYIEIAQAVNKRTIGIFNKFQAVTGNQYYSSINTNVAMPIQFRQSYRQLYTFGAIVAGATATITHNLTGFTQFVSTYGNCITDGMTIATAIYLPIPYASATTLNQQIELQIDNTNIYVINGAGANNIVSGTVVLEYLLN